jgi:hypothetical protein
LSESQGERKPGWLEVVGKGRMAVTLVEAFGFRMTIQIGELLVE